MFDRHRAEITVMQFIGHSLPVHQSVNVPWDFNPIPYCQPISPTPMEYPLRRLWNGMFGGVGGQYTTITPLGHPHSELNTGIKIIVNSMMDANLYQCTDESLGYCT